MPRRPCLEQLPNGRTCGALSAGTYCEPHRLARGRAKEHGRNRPGPRQRGLDHTYDINRVICLANSDRCWLCGHPGADQADHAIPVSMGGTSALSNLRPAHGTAPCPTCGRHCNQERGNRTA
jgi:hypothetical protein